MTFRPAWLCIDLAFSGTRIAYCRGGRSLGRTEIDGVGPFVPPGESFPLLRPAIEEAAARLRADRKLPPAEGVLAALPDAWFRIGLVRPGRPSSKGRAGDYFRWKASADWGLPVEKSVLDWQPTAPPWVREAPVLLAAAGPAVTGALEAPVAGLPILVAVPRCLAGWGATAGPPRGSRAFVLVDGNAFAFFGATGGRLRYFRNRVCACGGEREEEVEETVRHFSRSAGAGEATLQAIDPEAPIAGLSRHPLVSGIFS